MGNHFKTSSNPQIGLSYVSLAKSIIVGDQRAVVSSIAWRVNHSFERRMDTTCVLVS